MKHAPALVSKTQIPSVQIARAQVRQNNDKHMALSSEDKSDVIRKMGKGVASKVEKATRDSAKTDAIKKRGHYSIFRYDAGGKYGEHPGKTRIKHNLSHGDMHKELKHNPEYRGTDKHGFMGGRTYSKK